VSNLYCNFKSQSFCWQGLDGHLAGFYTYPVAIPNQSQIEVDILHRSILAKAFRGELVPQDPNDEPAAVLLERIRAERERTSTPKQRGKTTRKNSSKQLSIDGLEWFSL